MIATTSKKLITFALGAGVAGMVAPALMLLGAASAQAETNVTTTTDAAGVTVRIQSWHPWGSPAENASSGACTYTAIPVNVPAGILPPLPVYGVPFYLQKNATHNLWFPGIQTGSTWDVTVNCAEGNDSPTQQVTY